MANEITATRQMGYIPEEDLFYEDAAFQPGTSEEHDKDTLNEFEKMENVFLNMDSAVTALHIPETIPAQPVCNIIFERNLNWTENLQWYMSNTNKIMLIIYFG